MAPDALVGSERLEQVQRALQQAGMAALVCRLPENVFFLTGYWPLSSFAFAVVPAAGEPALLLVRTEQLYAEKARVQDIRTFGWGTLADGDPYAQVEVLLAGLAQERGLRQGTIGIELGFEQVAAGHNWAEPLLPAAPTQRLIGRAFAGCTLADAAPLLHELRAIKSAEDIEGLRVANEVAQLGLAAFVEHFQPGRTEAEVAAAVEHAIYARGTGYQPAGGGAPVRRVRAWAQLMTGPDSALAYSPFPASSARRIRPGDLGVLELGTVVDGYWSDLTRTRVAGVPDERQRAVHHAVLEAQRAALQAMRPGVSGTEVDAAARAVLERADLGQAFVHHTGHGIGFRYHEPVPLLAPAGERPLAAGMVTSLEPGVYLAGWGGLRIEDNIVVTPTGAESLSTFDRNLT